MREGICVICGHGFQSNRSNQVTCLRDECRLANKQRAIKNARANVAGLQAGLGIPSPTPPPRPHSPIPDFYGDKQSVTQSYPYTEDTDLHPDASRPPQPADVNDVASHLARMALDLGCSVMLLRDGASVILKLNPQLRSESTVQSGSTGQSGEDDLDAFMARGDK